MNFQEEMERIELKEHARYCAHFSYPEESRGNKLEEHDIRKTQERDRGYKAAKVSAPVGVGLYALYELIDGIRNLLH